MIRQASAVHQAFCIELKAAVKSSVAWILFLDASIQDWGRLQKRPNLTQTFDAQAQEAERQARLRPLNKQSEDAAYWQEHGSGGIWPRSNAASCLPSSSLWFQSPPKLEF